MSARRNGGVLVGAGWLLLLAAGCGAASSASEDAAGSGGTGAGRAGSKNTDGGKNSAGSSSAGSSSGGSNNGGGAKAGAGNSSGSNGNAGAAGSPPAGGCRQSTDCPVMPMTGAVPFGTPQCLSPDQPTPATSCGAPGWCGRCDCPPQPMAPEGNGLACQTSSDCPAPSAGANKASICAQGACTECASDSDCPALMPSCGSVQSIFAAVIFNFRFCSRCTSDAQCSGTTPHCSQTIGQPGACVACGSDQDCAQGVCSGGACVPGCSADEPCPNPLTECTANQRCEVRACSGDSECPPPNNACQGGHCLRRPCQDDSQCDVGGTCVNARCYETPGRCFSQRLAP